MSKTEVEPRAAGETCQVLNSKTFSKSCLRDIAREATKYLDSTTMFTYSHANTLLRQSERAYYLSYFINCHRP